MTAEFDPDLLERLLGLLKLLPPRGGWDAKKLGQVSGEIFRNTDDEYLWQCNRCGGFFVADDPSIMYRDIVVGMVEAEAFYRHERELVETQQRADRYVAESPCTCEQRDFRMDPEIDDETRAKAMFVASVMERNARDEENEGADQIYISTCWNLSKPENRAELDRACVEMFDEGMGMVMGDFVSPRPGTVPPRQRSWRRSWRRVLARALRAAARRFDRT